MLLLLYGGGGDVRLVIKSIQSPFVFFSYFRLRLLYFTAWTLPIYFLRFKAFYYEIFVSFCCWCKEEDKPDRKSKSLFTNYKPYR